MANRVVISICGEEYTFVAEESASYMQKVGAYVSDKMTEVLDSSRVGRSDAAILTAVNIADEYRGKKSVLFESCGGFEDTGVVALGVDDLAGIGLKYLYQIFKHG